MSEYTEPLSGDYADLMTIEEFRGGVECGLFVDYDGYGSPVKEVGGVLKHHRTLRIWPSLLHEWPKDATHIEWYNR